MFKTNVINKLILKYYIYVALGTTNYNPVAKT
jgi:hypothetical protein